MGRVLALFRLISSSKFLASLMVTAKTLIGFYQIISEAEEVFIIELPLKVVRIIESLSWLHLDISDLIQLECVGLAGYTNHLRLVAATPAPLVLLLGVGALLREALVEKKRGRDLKRDAFLRALPWVLFLTFLVIPDISSLAFRAFRCECFGDELTGDRQSWLRADYSLQCTTNSCPDDALVQWTAEWLMARRSAWAVLWVYAVGIPCVYALLLLCERHTIMDEEHTPLADALGFLHNGYKPTCYGWELASVVHKLITVGFASLIKPDTLMQLMIVVLIMLVYQLLLVIVRPYRFPEAGALAFVEQTSLVVFITLCFIVKADHLARQAADEQMMQTLEKRFFYDTELVTNVMVGSLVTAVTVAAIVTLRQTAPIAMHAWREALAFGVDAPVVDARSEAKLRAARRAAARDRLRAALDQRASTLEVPEFLYAEDAEINPVLSQRIAADRQRSQRQRCTKSAGLGRLIRDTGSSSSSRPKRLDGALRLLKLDIAADKQTDRSTEAAARMLHLQMKRRYGVHGLVGEDMEPEEVPRLRRRVRAASRKAPVANAHERHHMLQLATCRYRLENKGWAGAEKLSPRTRWDLSRHMILQGRLTDDEGAEVQPPRMSRRAPRASAGLSRGSKASESVTASRTKSSATSARDAVTQSSRRKSQLEGLARAMFDRFDSNGDGQLNAKELALLCADLGHDLTDKQLRLAVKSLDADGSGSIDFDEFMKWFELGLRTDVLKGQNSASSQLARHDEQVAASKQRLEDQMVLEEASRRQGFSVGQRVVHGKRGAGVVSELMEDGRTRVTFDDGQEHRYAPESIYKLVPLDPAAAPASLGAGSHEGSEGGDSCGDRASRASLTWARSRGAVAAVGSMASSERSVAEGSSSMRRGGKVNRERAEMLESEQLIEQHAKRKRGRRCSLSLKDRPGRETFRKGAQQCTPRTGAGSSKDHAASPARVLSADGLDEATEPGGSTVLSPQSAPTTSLPLASLEDLAA